MATFKQFPFTATVEYKDGRVFLNLRLPGGAIFYHQQLTAAQFKLWWELSNEAEKKAVKGKKG